MEEKQLTEENGEELTNREENETLTPEEVLERAKRENEKLGDERQRGRMQLGNYVGFIATTFSCVVVMLVMTFINGEVPTGLMAVLLTGIAAQNIAQACVLYRKKVRVISVVCAALITIAALIYWALWILELCGVSI